MKTSWDVVETVCLAPSLICIFHVLSHKRLLGDRHIRNQKGRVKLKTLVSCLYYTVKPIMYMEHRVEIKCHNYNQVQ